MAHVNSDEQRQRGDERSEGQIQGGADAVGSSANARDSAHHPAPPPFNPLSADGGSSGAVPNSVVPDLMRVYESLTSSKQSAKDGSYQGGPSGGSDEFAYATAPGHTFGQSGADANSATSYYPPVATGNWTYDTTSIPVPPIPSMALAALSAQATGLKQEDTQGESHKSHDSEQSTTTGRPLRKRASTSSPGAEAEDISCSGSSKGIKSRRKGKDTSGRWSKRFTWPDELHRDFVSAIFDVGLKHSSPSAILEHMPKHEQITSERVKSHLQKYRLHRDKSKREFMTSYEAAMNAMRKDGVHGMASLAAGEVAAHATLEMSEEGDGSAIASRDGGDRLGVEKDSSTEDASKQSALPHESLRLPRLTEAEKQSPIGSSMGYLMGLFFSLKEQLLAHRAAQAKNQPVAAVYNAFVNGHAVPGSNDPSSATASGSAAAGPPSARSNIEESSMMKREMQSQMAFQNKMRALKQQELNKYKPPASYEGGDRKEEPIEDAKVGQSTKPAESSGQQDFQGAGEMATDNRNRGLSIGAEDEFWNTDVVDEQLFEFLMSGS